MNDNLLEEANQLYRAKNYEAATEAYSKIATELLLEKQNSEMAEKAMAMTLKSYRKLVGSHVVRRLNNDYFAVYQHYQDHKKADQTEVDAVIYSEIIPGVAQKRVYFDPYSKTFYVMNENEVKKSRKTIGPYPIAVVSARGPREEMEDTHLATTLEKGFLFAVFDGHGGDFCAHYMKSRLKPVLERYLKKINLNDNTQLYNALVATCIRLDENWNNNPHSDYWSGAAAIIALIIDDSLWVAGIGDSRAVLGVDGKAIQLSEDAKPYVRKYYKEILSRGGYVKWDRVDGSLDMARSLGDINHPSVSARPEIRKYNLNHKEILILACDGLWDVVGSQEAIDICQELSSVEEMAETLKTLAYESGSTDNVTVMAIDLRNFTEVAQTVPLGEKSG